MKGNQAFSQQSCEIGRHGPVWQQMIEGGIDREASHDRCPFNRFAVATDREAGTRANDRFGRDVDVISQATVEPNFVFTSTFSAREFGQIDETVVDRAFDFDDPISGEEEMRNVRVEPIHAIDRPRIRGWFGQKTEKFVRSNFRQRFSPVTRVRDAMRSSGNKCIGWFGAWVRVT